MDYKINMNGKAKIFHANLLKAYYEREADTTADATAGTHVASAVLIAENQHDEVEYVDEGGLELRPEDHGETSKDIRVSDSLTEQQQEQVQKLLDEYSDVFTNKPGSTELAKHSIDLTTQQPVRVRPRQMPFATQGLVQKEVQDMMEMGIIEPSNSAYGSPVVLVAKKDGSIRFCIDYRRLNAVTKFDSEPMGNPQDIMAKLHGRRYFAKFDFTKGYWQIPMDEASKEKTAFVVPGGCYQFCRMPFGLVNSAATYNRMMRRLLAGSSNIEHYVDDVLVHSATWDEHLDSLKDLLERVRQAGLTMRPTKCCVGFQEVEFLGHRIGQDEIAMDNSKLTRIQDAPEPTTKTQVRSFLGLTGYYRRFVPNYAQTAAPLTDLLKKGQPNRVTWLEEHANAFRKLKEALTSSPILRTPDFSRKFIVRCDASDVGLGAVLLQDFEDGPFPIAYASRKLKSSERRYFTEEKECLAIVFAVKHFQFYLYGTEFVVQTDHKPLVYIQRCKIESPRVMRWAMTLQNYKFHVEDIPGKSNVGADYLSRLRAK